MPQPELIIFDCDGVLIDSEGLAHRALVEVLSDCGVHMSCAEAVERYAGRPSAFEKDDIESRYSITLPEDIFEQRRTRLIQLFEECLQPIPGIFELIDALPFKKCVASGSSPERLRHSLGLTGLWDFFTPHVFSATQVAHGKPAPDLFLFAAEQMGVPPSACLVIEDSTAGVSAAVAANMRVFGFTGGEHCLKGHADILRDLGAEKVFANMDHIAETLHLTPKCEADCGS